MARALPVFRDFRIDVDKKGVFTPHYTIENRKSNGKTWSWGIDKRPKLCYDKV
jgi:hypothetical protein